LELSSSQAARPSIIHDEERRHQTEFFTIIGNYNHLYGNYNRIYIDKLSFYGIICHIDSIYCYSL